MIAVLKRRIRASQLFGSTEASLLENIQQQGEMYYYEETTILRFPSQQTLKLKPFPAQGSINNCKPDWYTGGRDNGIILIINTKIES